MGRSVIEITVVGNHGCDRRAQPGEKLRPVCEDLSCVDCMTRKFVTNLALRNDVESATQTHWPEGPAIQDDLLKNERKRGAF